MIWCCPTHHQELRSQGELLHAECCDRDFQVVEGIPDLRESLPAWVDFARDLEAARVLADRVPADDVALSIHTVFSHRTDWSTERISKRTAMTLAIADRMRIEWRGWLAEAASHPGPLLDLGCGAGSLLSVAPAGVEKIGLDVSMEWLVVTRRICAAAGVEVHLAGALAEALPLANGSVGIVTALDVIEHVGDQAGMVREIDRVLQPMGIFRGATPNRYSVSAEPHVGVWGVGWLPRSMQAGYVRWRADLPYDSTALLSCRDISRVFRQNASFTPIVEPAPIPLAELGKFGWRRRALATGYNGLLKWPLFRPIARNFGAFFHIWGTKPRTTGAPGLLRAS